MGLMLHKLYDKVCKGFSFRRYNRSRDQIGPLLVYRQRSDFEGGLILFAAVIGITVVQLYFMKKVAYASTKTKPEPLQSNYIQKCK